MLNVNGEGLGRVGICKSNPMVALDVLGDTQMRNVYCSNIFPDSITIARTAVVFESTNGYVRLRGADGGGGEITEFPNQSNKINYIMGNTSICRFGGNLGVGVGPPSSYKVDVNGTINTTGLRINSSTINHIQRYSLVAGSSSGRKLGFSITGSFPSGNYSVFPSIVAGSSSIDDNFAVVIMSKSSTNITGSICRVDATGGWAASITLELLIVGS